ncbi:hypothetical protein [uncultured Algibacter sp.]|uniref:hypothetical protein n=1 Tax=uncultured Algibacter sp. TaxID=298659 RepID=UPI00263275F7|nr:hypothetical protein [uncultured Algibacter sp.]
MDIISNVSQTFLDSIPLPLEQNIEGHLDDYFITQGHIYGFRNKDIKALQYFNKALNYAEKENDYENAGDACVQLYRTSYTNSKDSLAISYLDKAKYYFKKSNYKYGLYEIELIEAYMKYINSESFESIKMLLPNLDKYKAILNEDGYIYMEANAQLAMSYIDLDSINKARKYIRNFETTKGNATIDKNNYYSFRGSLNVNLAEFFLEKNKQIDSCTFYLSKARTDFSYLHQTYIVKYYNLFVNLYNSIENLELAKTYVDSITIYENEIFQTHFNASLDIGSSIKTTEDKLKIESNKRKRNVILVFVLFLVLIFISILYFVFYRRQKLKLNKVSSKVDTLSKIKSNNEQLVVKVHGLEEYISNLKEEVKNISRIESIQNQKEKIKELYKNLHINSSTLLDKSENHLELVNDLNIDFFTKIKEKYPQLNKSEIIICYYLYMGFINKEIGLFLNTTVRSVESKRYRISKKINLIRKEKTLVEHLQNTFRKP